MPRTVVVTEGDSPLGAALVRLLAARGWSVVAAVAPSDAPGAAPPSSPGAPGLSMIAWNRRSPVSARNLLLSALNAFTSVEEVIVLEPPGPRGAPLAETASVDVERALDDARGPVFVAREALGYFQPRKSGILCMVSRGPAGGPLQAGVRECFRGLTAALLPGVGDGIIVNGFQSGEVEAEEYAAYIDRTLEEKARKISGRWFTFQPRGGFFQGVLAGGSRKG